MSMNVVRMRLPGSSGRLLTLMALVSAVGIGEARAQATRVSAPRFGAEASGGTSLSRPAVSTTGQYVAFASDLGLLSGGDANGFADVFVRDMQSSTIVRISVATGGGQANGPSDHPSVSGDGRYVAFQSSATNVVASDTNFAADIFVTDRDTDADGIFDEPGAVATARVSVATGGAQANGPSTKPAISGNGRYVAFLSRASNLVAGDTNGLLDVFVHDRQTGATTRVSVATGGGQGTGGPSPVPPPVGTPSISADGRYVVFDSNQTNLVAGDTNGYTDVFLHDRQTTTTTRLSQSGATQANTGSLNPVISADGAWVAYETWANNLPGATTGNTIRDIILVNRATGAVLQITPDGELAAGHNASLQPTLSSDGRYLAFESFKTNLVATDTNQLSDIFVWDRLNPGTFVRVSAVGTPPAETQGNGHSATPAISGDGRYVAYNTWASNLLAGDTNQMAEPALADRLTLTSAPARVALVSGAQATRSARSGESSLSGNGRYLAFSSTSSQLVAGDTNHTSDVYVHDRVANTVDRASIDGAIELGGDSPSISADGRFVAFRSGGQIWLRDRHLGLTTRISNAPNGTAGNGASEQPSISASGRFVAFSSVATNLVAAAGNNLAQIFVYDRITGVIERISVSSGGAPALANGNCRFPSISGDGRYVVYESPASNLVAGDTNAASDIFLRDRQTSTTTRVSVRSNGTQGDRHSYTPKISANGRVVVFASDATDLFAAPDNDINGNTDVFLRDLDAGTTVRISINAAGIGGFGNSDAPAVSFSGRYVVFASQLTLDTPSPALDILREVYVKDRVTNQVARLSNAPGPAQPIEWSDFPATSADGLYVAFESPAWNLAAGDNNGDVDVFLVARTAGADVDATLSTGFKNQFGLVPGIDGANQDPDGDGRTNAQEAADGTHPNGLFARYLAEGANSSFFDTTVALLNPGTFASHAQLRYLKGDGTSVSQVVEVPPLTRATIATNTTGGLSTAEFSTVIETDASIVVDRTMRWDASHYGSHTETGVVSPATTWYLAEGSTLGAFQLFYLLQNPSTTTDSNVRIRYLLPTGAPLEKTYVVTRGSRRTIWVNQETFSGQALLASTDVSGVVEVTNGVPVVAERAMYLSGAQVFAAGHESAGVVAPQLSWFLAEGATGAFFDLFVLISNSTAQDANVLVTYLLPSGATHSKSYVIPANSRRTIWVDNESFPGVGQVLQNTAVSTTVASTNNVPIVVERAMWWPGPTSATWTEAHNSPGATATGTVWALAEGEDGGADQTETYILIANTSNTAGSARVTIVFEDGTTAVQTYNLNPNSRTNVPVRNDFAGVSGRRFGAIVESLGASPAQIVVERAMYGNSGGVFWAAGTNALGTRLK
jgi:Tol biopolymer transport system component